MTLERCLNDSALDTSTAPMNQPHFAQTRFSRRSDVLLDDRSNVGRREGV